MLNLFKDLHEHIGLIFLTSFLSVYKYNMLDIWLKKDNSMHEAPANTGRREESDHIGSIVDSFILH